MSDMGVSLFNVVSCILCLACGGYFGWVMHDKIHGRKP